MAVLSTIALLPGDASSGRHALLCGSSATVTMMQCMQQGGFFIGRSQGACTKLNVSHRSINLVGRSSSHVGHELVVEIASLTLSVSKRGFWPQANAQRDGTLVMMMKVKLAERRVYAAKRHNGSLQNQRQPVHLLITHMLIMGQHTQDLHGRYQQVNIASCTAVCMPSLQPECTHSAAECVR